MTELIDGLYYEGEKIADTKAPHSVPIDRRWEQRKFEAKLVNPANRRKLDIIVVGSGLAGGAAAASLGEQGYNVKCFFYQDSARRAHSIAAQGGINAAKNYRNDNDSVYRLFYEACKFIDIGALLLNASDDRIKALRSLLVCIAWVFLHLVYIFDWISCSQS